MSLYKICVLGLGGVGKTATVIQYCSNHFVEYYDPTIEDSYRKRAVIDNESCVLELLDTAGQEDYPGLQAQWIRDTDGFVIVFSLTDRPSFDEIGRYRERIYQIKGHHNAPTVLIGNKCDLISQRVVYKEEIEELVNVFGCSYYETSAKDRINIVESFHHLVKQIRSLRPNHINHNSTHRSRRRCYIS